MIVGSSSFAWNVLVANPKSETNPSSSTGNFAETDFGHQPPATARPIHFQSISPETGKRSPRSVAISPGGLPLRGDSAARLARRMPPRSREPRNHSDLHEISARNVWPVPLSGQHARQHSSGSRRPSQPHEGP